MFIDEAHTMIGAGGPAGQNDAANLLKPHSPEANSDDRSDNMGGIQEVF